MDRDRELVEEARLLLTEVKLEGEWYIFEKEGRTPLVSRDDITWSKGIGHHATVWFANRGWTVTPIIIYKTTSVR